MTTRKFFKTRIVVEILTEDEPTDSNMELNDVHHFKTVGGASGQVVWEDPVRLNGQEAVMELIEQGSDPGFFGIDQNSEDIV